MIGSLDAASFVFGTQCRQQQQRSAETGSPHADSGTFIQRALMLRAWDGHQLPYTDLVNK